MDAAGGRRVEIERKDVKKMQGSHPMTISFTPYKVCHAESMILGVCHAPSRGD